MKQNRASNIANTIPNAAFSQSEFYDLFLRATEIDLENIKMVSGTGVAIELISPSLIAIIDKEVDDLAAQAKINYTQNSPQCF